MFTGDLSTIIVGRRRHDRLSGVSSESKPSQPLSPEALAQLVAGHREFLAFLERRVESRAAAEDILQAAFARGLERGGSVPDEKVVAWFYRVLRNSVIDHYRHRASSARAMEAWGREFTEGQEPDAALRQEICQCVSGLLATLKPEYRDALRVVDLEDGKLSDLAQQSGITAENAAVRVHRARKALRRQVEKACGTCEEHGCFDCQCHASEGSPCHPASA
jgi:RNA polymerase sigma-70 factor, ECF subfamily